MFIRGTMLLTLAAILAIVGCQKDNGTAVKSDKSDRTAAVKTKHDHWWCDEHGIPEEMCSMCSSKVAEKCKKEGDWCDKHERAKSQCFKCDPSLQEKFAVLYRAKYPGKEPPAPTE
jgi:hypothetical protein